MSGRWHGGPLWPPPGVLGGASASFPNSVFLGSAEEPGHGPGGQWAWALRSPQPWWGCAIPLSGLLASSWPIAGCHLPAFGGPAPAPRVPALSPLPSSATVTHNSTGMRCPSLTFPGCPPFGFLPPLDHSCSDQVEWPCDNAEEVSWTW